MTTLTLGQQLDDISHRLTAATDAWVAAGHPWDGPVWEAREAVFADLRAWNEKAASR